MKYLTVYQGAEAEIVEKKSRFIATTGPAASEEDALGFIRTVKKRYADASHNCSAYIIGNKQELQHSSDDGEPSGTAGKPILDVLSGKGLCNAVVVVTRYFGGTLLGTGGLTRAYSKTAKEGLKESVILDKIYAKKIKIQTDYTNIGRIQYITSQSGFDIINTEYTDVITLEVLIEPDAYACFAGKITEATSACALLTGNGECFYARYQNKLLLFES